MESRKIQKVGAATLTISLPKEWAEQRNLKKVDQVCGLGEEPGMPERLIVGNHVLGREKIIVRSPLRLRSAHQDEVRRAIRRLMGIGIIEESPSKVVLQCSINPSNYPLDALIKRLYNLGATMLSESL